jgi:NAD(P)-dependent dehydrogenase (short-subunit alcohol dehydrogenase family)
MLCIPAVAADYFKDFGALVVGGSSGIGRSVGLQLARAGATVVFAGRDEAALLEAVKEARAVGTKAYAACQVEVRAPETLERAIAVTFEVAGRFDLMFNGAGSGMLAYAEDMTLAHYEEVIQTNLMGVVHGVHAAYPIMKRQGRGHIVNVSSLAGLLPMPASTAYCAAKYGVVGLSEALRLEAAEEGVKVSVVCPAAVSTPIFERAAYINLDKAKLASSPPPGGFQTSDDCARQILDGIQRNRGVITPGKAGAIAALSRHFPSLWFMAGKGFGRKLRAGRTLPPVERTS